MNSIMLRPACSAGARGAAQVEGSPGRGRGTAADLAQLYTPGGTPSGTPPSATPARNANRRKSLVLRPTLLDKHTHAALRDKD